MADPLVLIDPETSKRNIPCHSAPCVKLPNVKRPVTPGPNSWAQSEEHEKVSANIHRMQPTNRNMYEDKASLEVSPEISNNTTLRPRRQIQPAIPLVNLLPPNQKNRAITDPGPFRSLTSTRKPSVTQLKKKERIFEFSSSKVDLSGGSDLPLSNIPPKALALLGVQQEVEHTLSPAANQDQTLIEIQQSPKRAAVSPSKPARQAKSDPVATRRPSNHRIEESSVANVVTPVNLQTPQRRQERDGLSVNLAESQCFKLENSSGSLRPPVIAGYGNVGKQHGVVRQQVLHPSESFRGIIETVSPTHTEACNTLDFERKVTPTKIVQREPSGEFLRPTIYSPTAYTGSWEHDPAAGHTLPPFTPMPKTGHPDHEYVPAGLTVGSTSVFQDVFRERFPRNPSAMHDNEPQETQSSPTQVVFRSASGHSAAQNQQPHHTQSLNKSVETEIQPQSANSVQSCNGMAECGPKSRLRYPTTYGQHGLQQAILDSRTLSVFDRLPLSSANSWAPTLNTSSAPMSAPLPPRRPALHLHNPVPSPPASQQNYQRPSPLSAGLAQLDMTLHHHIDSIFNSLLRQIADKHDQTTDRVLQRIDNLDDRMSKELKALRVDTNSTRKEVSKQRAAASEDSYRHDSVQSFLQTLDRKLDGLENHISEIKCKDRIELVEQSNRGTKGQHHKCQSAHHRTESTHSSFGGPLSSGDQRLHLKHQTGAAATVASRSSGKSCQSGNSNGIRVEGSRLRAASGSSCRQVGEMRMAVDWTEGRKKPKGPDLRDHPAYQQQENYEEKEKVLTMEESYLKQSLSEGKWYHQAYGKGF